MNDPTNMLIKIRQLIWSGQKYYEQIIRDVILSQTHDLYYTYISLKSGGKKFEFHKEDHQKT